MPTMWPENPWALVLAGGDGKRLQEFTREIAGVPIPKQYCRLLGEQSLLEATLARTLRFAPPERTLVVVNDNHLALARAQLGALPSQNVLVQEPVPQAYWYYCPSAQAYYPTVKNCPEAWIKVPPLSE